MGDRKTFQVSATHLTKTVNGTKSDELHFFYDAQGRPAMVKHGDNLYRYVHNLQGDIVGMIDGAGTLVLEYKYDAWGNHISTVPEHGVGAINPFRYRGYIFDADVGLYYLHSRYYHGDCSRFISGDSLLNNRLLNGVYTYCLNNPIIFFDSDGKNTYSVYLNVYNEEDSGLSTGHYDISIISNDSDVFVFQLNEKEYKCESLTFSYGGVSGDESQGRVNVYNQGSRPDRNVTRRYLIYSDMSQSEFDEFIEWFASDFAKYDKLDGGMATYLVKDDTYKKYSIKNRIFCGSGATYLLSQVKGISDESSNRRALAFRLLKKRFENNTLVVDLNVFRWLDRWFMTPVKR